MPGYALEQDVIYKAAGDELVVINLKTGRIFFFNKEAQNYLEAFKKNELIEEEGVLVSEFIKKLLEFKLIKKSSSGKQLSVIKKQPRFLRESDKTLDQITLLCP